MKNRILTFVIGMFTGAIIMTLLLMFFNKPIEGNNIEKFPLNENGQFRRPNGNMGEPPEKPSGDMNQSFQ